MEGGREQGRAEVCWELARVVSVAGRGRCGGRGGL